jgi:hypothetical protein
MTPSPEIGAHLPTGTVSGFDRSVAVDLKHASRVHPYRRGRRAPVGEPSSSHSGQGKAASFCGKYCIKYTGSWFSR